jgi:hypothetical protein
MQKNIMTAWNCSTEWPICLFDFTTKSKCPNYFAFRVFNSFNDFILEDYFYGDIKNKGGSCVMDN